MSYSLRPHARLQHARLPSSTPSPVVCPSSCPLNWWCHPTISSSVTPFFFCPQSFPASRSFPMSRLFPAGGQSIGTSDSTSVFPMNIQSLFPLRSMGLISLLSKGLSIVFFSTTVWKHQFFGTLVFFMVQLWLDHNYWHDYWKGHSLEYMDLCWQRDVFAF